jgi:hypothetical protein
MLIHGYSYGDTYRLDYHKEGSIRSLTSAKHFHPINPLFKAHVPHLQGLSLE